MSSKIKKINEYCEKCSGSKAEKSMLREMVMSKKLDDDWFNKVKRLFEGAIAIGNMPSSRFVLMHEWLIQAVYGKPSPQQKAEIDIHLTAIRIASTEVGKEAPEADKRFYKKIEAAHMDKIKEIHEGYYYTIKIQSDDTRES